MNYNWNDKYILNASFRRDGSSRFGPNRRFGNFWAAGLAWVFSNEKLFSDNLSILSYGKLRSSYGVTGNDQITDYQYLDTYRTIGTYQNLSGLYPARVANPDYSWEVTKKIEAALELGFVGDRLFVSVAWYQNRSGNQLVTYGLPTQTGFSGYQANLPALVQNTGLELELNARILEDRAFRWETMFNLTFPKNTLLSFPNFESSSYSNTYEIGEPLSVVRGYQFLGINSESGQVEIADINNDGSVNSTGDYVVIGNEMPRLFGGLVNNFKYKGLELDVLFQFVSQEGGGIVHFNPPGYGLVNHTASVMNRWKAPGNITDISGATTTITNPIRIAYYNRYNNSSGNITDASYLRLKNVSLAYTLPTNWIRGSKLTNCRIYLQGQNLLTFTRYKGFDPEFQRIVVPSLRMITVGIKVTL